MSPVGIGADGIAETTPDSRLQRAQSAEGAGTLHRRPRPPNLRHRRSYTMTSDERPNMDIW